MMALCFLYLVKVESSVFCKRSESELGLNLTQIKKNRESYKSPVSESFFFQIPGIKINLIYLLFYIVQNLKYDSYEDMVCWISMLLCLINLRLGIIYIIT